MTTKKELRDAIHQSPAGVDLDNDDIDEIVSIIKKHIGTVYLIQRNAIDYSAHTTVFPAVYATKELARQYIADHFSWFTFDKPIEPYFTILELTPVESLPNPPLPPTG